MLTRRAITKSANSNPKAITQLMTANEYTLLTHADVTAVFDAKRVQARADKYVVTWYSRVLGSGGAEQIAYASDWLHGLVYYPTTDSQYGIWFGYLNDATTVNTNHTTMLGNTAFVLPSGSWYVADLSAVATPAAVCVSWATSDSTTQLARAFDSSGRIRRYYDYSATLSQSTSTPNDGALHLWEDTFDGTNWVSYKDRTQEVTASTAMPSITDRKIRMNSVNNGGSTTGLAKGYRELFVVGAPTTSLRTAVKNVVAERHPGLVLA